jgi:hypothetical protein
MAWALPAWAGPGEDLEQALRGTRAAGGVLMLRHARAPGTFDPPGFQVGECATQRNLDEEGRRQARQLGTWFATRQLRPARVRSSPWCRCLETARLAFGDPVEPWSALGSPHAASEPARAQALALLREGLARVVQRGAGFEVWVTHMFVFSALLGEGADSGEGVLLGLGADGSPRVRARVTGLVA